MGPSPVNSYISTPFEPNPLEGWQVDSMGCIFGCMGDVFSLPLDQRKGSKWHWWMYFSGRQSTRARSLLDQSSGTALVIF